MMLSRRTCLAVLVYTLCVASGSDSVASADSSFEGDGMFGSRVTSAETMLSYIEDLRGLNVHDLSGVTAGDTVDEARQNYVVIDAFVGRLVRIERVTKGVLRERPSDVALVAAATKVKDAVIEIKIPAARVISGSQVLVKVRAILKAAEQRNYDGVPNREVYAEILRAVPALERQIEILFSSTQEVSGDVAINGNLATNGDLASVAGWEQLDSVKMLRELWIHTKDALNDAFTTYKGYFIGHRSELPARVVSLEEGLAGLSLMTQKLLGVRLSVRVAAYAPTGYEFEVLVINQSGEVRGVIYLCADPTRTDNSSGPISSFVRGRPGAAFVTVKAEPVTEQFSPTGELSLRLRALKVSETQFASIVGLVSSSLGAFLPDVGLEMAAFEFSGVVLPLVISGVFDLFSRDYVDALFSVPVNRPSRSVGLFAWSGAVGIVSGGPQLVGASVGRKNVATWAVLGADPSQVAWAELLKLSKVSSQASISTLLEVMLGSEVREFAAATVLAAMIHSHGHYRQKIYDLVPYRLQERVDLVDGSYPMRIQPSTEEAGFRFAVEEGLRNDPWVAAFGIVPQLASRYASDENSPLEKILDYAPYVDEIRASVSRERAALNSAPVAGGMSTGRPSYAQEAPNRQRHEGGNSD